MESSNIKFWSRCILIAILFFIIALIGASCDAQKRVARIIDRHPELAKDTFLLDYDTAYFSVPAVRKDSVVHISSFMHDTIFLKQDRLTVKTYVYNDSVYIEGECDEIHDTVFSIEKIPYKQVLYPEEKLEWWKWLLIGFVLYLIGKEIVLWRQKRGSSQ